MPGPSDWKSQSSVILWHLQPRSGLDGDDMVQCVLGVGSMLYPLPARIETLVQASCPKTDAL